jgi:hypothetical protein
MMTYQSRLFSRPGFGEGGPEAVLIHNQRIFLDANIALLV